MAIYIWDNVKEKTIFDYDFTTTNPSSELIWYQASYGYTQISWSWLRTYNVSSSDRGWRAARLIWEDVSDKTITMDGTWLAQFGSTWTWFWFSLSSAENTTNGGRWNRVCVDLGTTYYSSFNTYDKLYAPWITDWTWNVISWFWRTIWTSWNYTIRLLWELDLKNWTSHLEVYKNWNLFSTQDYTLTSSELSMAKSVATSNCYYGAWFNRWYTSVTLFMRKWKIVVTG